MSGILRALGAGTESREHYEEPPVFDVPVYEPDEGEVSGGPAPTAPKYNPSEAYLETMAFLAVLSFSAIASHLLPLVIANGTIAIWSGMWAAIIAAFGLCLTVPPALRKSIRSKQHARRKLMLAVALTTVICFVSWIIATQ